MVLQLNAKRLRELPLFSFASLHVCIFYPVTYYLGRLEDQWHRKIQHAQKSEPDNKKSIDQNPGTLLYLAEDSFLL